MLQFFRRIDQFGVQEKLQIPPIDPTQKSAFGGITTLFLYTVSLAYFIYQLVDWQNNNKLPKYSSLKAKIDENETLICSDVFAEIQFFQFMAPGSVDPFDPRNLIFQPVLQQMPSDWKDIKIIDLELIQTDGENGTQINKFLISNVKLQGQPDFSNSLIKIDYQLQLQKCNQSQLDATKYACANETTVNKFEEQQNFFQIQLYIEQFDAKSKQLTKIPKQFIIDMRKGFMQYQVFQLKVNSLTLDDGFLFPNDKKINFFSDLQVTALQYDEEYSKIYYGQYFSSILYFQIDTLKEKSTLEYPKISEILANTGSIVTFIMQLSLLVSKYNEHLCISKAKKKIIKMYYSDYGQYRVIKNWKGGIQQVQRNGEVYKQKPIIDFFKRLDSTATLKINYINLQLEVSKLQYLMSNLLQPDQIKDYLKESNNRQISRLIQQVNECEDYQSGQKFINRIVPQSEDFQISNERIEINAQILEEDIKKSIDLLVLNQQDLNELEEQNEPNLKCQVQVINLANNSIQ